MTRHCLRALGVEFDEGGNTLWIQGEHGTLLRIKTTGAITTKRCQGGPAGYAHGDVQAVGDVEICIDPDADTDPLAFSGLGASEVAALGYLRAQALALAADQRRVGMAKTAEAVEEATAVLSRLISTAGDTG